MTAVATVPPVRSSAPVASSPPAKAASVPAEPPVARIPTKRLPEPEPAPARKAQPEPERILKTAKLTEPSAPVRQKEAPEKTVRRKTERDEEDEGDSRRPVKAVRVSEPPAKVVPHVKPASPGASEHAPRTLPPPPPPSVAPSESLRKLFNPHG